MAQYAQFSADTLARLESIFEEMMWLAARPNTRPGAARAWYSHVAVGPLIRSVRRFTGKVSIEAINAPDEKLVLEHFNRMQSSLSSLVATQLKSCTRDVRAFIDLIHQCEQVHIVTDRQNHDARRAKGDYASAGIVLADWKDIGIDTQRLLYAKKLKGAVSNAAAYAPKSAAKLTLPLESVPHSRVTN